MVHLSTDVLHWLSAQRGGSDSRKEGGWLNGSCECVGTRGPRCWSVCRSCEITCCTANTAFRTTCRPTARTSSRNFSFWSRQTEPVLRWDELLLWQCNRIWCAVFTCAHKLMEASLIYCMEAKIETEKWGREKLLLLLLPTAAAAAATATVLWPLYRTTCISPDFVGAKFYCPCALADDN